jgi:hypothetical protein
MSNLDLIFNSNDFRETEFDFKGSKVRVKTREITWSVKNKILGECFDYKTTGSAKFDFDSYNRKMLKAMIVEISVGGDAIPPSELNDVFYSRLNPAFGAALEKIVPKAFEEVNNDFLGRESGK